MSSRLDQAALEQRLVNQLQEALAAAPPEPARRASCRGKRTCRSCSRIPTSATICCAPVPCIPQMAKSILNDRGKDEKDRPLEFTADDLPPTCSTPTAAASGHLEDAATPRGAAGLAGRRRPDAQRAIATGGGEATSVGAGRLQQAMLEVRREFARQGKEIVLLIEDFAVIQGFQRDLLDALIEVGERDGRSELAPIRTLMAVTSGYYASLPDTVRTRVQRRDRLSSTAWTPSSIPRCGWARSRPS